MASFEWYVARRYLTARRRQAFISLISFVSILGVGVGVMALVIALALMTGVQSELRDRIVGTDAHVYVYKPGVAFGDLREERERLNVPGLIGFAPAILDRGLLTANGRPAFAQLKGIDPALEPDVTDIGRSVISGSLADLANRPEGEINGVILGADLAQELGVSVGDQVWAVTSQITPGPFTALPRQRPLQVVALVRFGFFTSDSEQALVLIDVAASLLRRDGPDVLQLKLADMDAAPRVRADLQKRLGLDYVVRDWTTQNGTLYSALWLEKVAISMAIGLIVLVAALNIVASLVLLVMEKTRDIAILRTMGASTGIIRRIFIYQGLAIGLIGTLSGTALGVAACLVLDRYQLIRLPSDVYQLTYLPFHVEVADIVIVVFSAIGVCLVATLYPSRQAARIDPAEALRHQ
jgi:lipoprotein-releasing system permease protein